MEKSSFDSSCLMHYLESHSNNVILTPLNSGTLGINFKAFIDGTARFIKTHMACPQCEKAICKEFSILSFLYGPTINPQLVTLNQEGNRQFYLIMDVLSPLEAPLSPDQVLSLIEKYSEKLKHNLSCDLMPQDQNFSHLLHRGERALQDLMHRGMIEQSIHDRVVIYLALLRAKSEQFLPCVCHGDLGPQNIMRNGDTPIVIDWEDAFWGIEGYDYLYWFSFFKHRKYLLPNIFGKTPWGKEIEIAILMLILVLKCELSLQNNSYLSNSITFNQRISEILALE